MRPPEIIRRALSTGAIAGMLSGCGASQSYVEGAPHVGSATIARFANVGSWMKPGSTANEPLLYMADGEEVDIYSMAGKQVGALKGFGFEAVYGLCSDSQGNVWVTYGGSLLEYTHGGTIPIAQVYTPAAPFSCAVDPTTGDLAVTEDSEGTANVAVYQAIYGTPQIYTDSAIDSYDYCTYDASGNLFVNGIRGRQMHLTELPSGGSTLGTVTLDEKIGRIGGLQWDGQYLAFGDSLSHVVYQFSVAGGHATTVSTTHFTGWTGRIFKTIEPFAIYNGVIVLTFSKRQTGFWKFPAGGKSAHRIGITTGAKTISVPPSGEEK